MAWAERAMVGRSRCRLFGSRTRPPIAAKSWNWAERQDRERDRPTLDERFLMTTPDVVGVAANQVDAEDRQQQVVADAGTLFCVSRLRVVVPKNSRAASSSETGALSTSTTPSTPIKAWSSPSPDITSTPTAHEITIGSWPACLSAASRRRPVIPVAPATAIRFVQHVRRVRSSVVLLAGIGAWEPAPAHTWCVVSGEAETVRRELQRCGVVLVSPRTALVRGDPAR